MDFTAANVGYVIAAYAVTAAALAALVLYTVGRNQRLNRALSKRQEADPK